MNPFKDRTPAITNNKLLRTPQREAHAALAQFAAQLHCSEREVGVVLPVGCGKSGCIALAPFAFRSNRTLVVAPGLKIADQLIADFEPSNPKMFYAKCAVLDGAPYPEPAEIRGKTTNRADLEEAQVVIANIQQLQGKATKWIEGLGPDFFDLILFDEGHHSVAESWSKLRTAYPSARIVNFSATPVRADGHLMAGRIVYSYSVFRAIRSGYVKRLKAVVLNPSSLRYVRREDEEEVEVDLQEVRRLGEEDAGFRRSIVTSRETLETIVDASIRELQKLRKASQEGRLKIIASALNYEHCRQIVEAYRSRNQRAGYVHSKTDGRANDQVLRRLENDELDVIVQVRKLGEGFDHPFLSVAAVFSIFASLSPFVQFAGRIMRVIKQDAPGDPVNSGTVVFHAGANVASRWQDFQQFSEADQEYFEQLLPLEDLEFSSAKELVVRPRVEGPLVDVRSQTEIGLEEIPLIEEDPEAQAALAVLRSKGFSGEEVKRALEKLEPVAVSRVRARQAKRRSLDERVRLEVGRILRERKVNPEGHELDGARRGRSNFVVLKAAIDVEVNRAVGRGSAERHEFSREQLEVVEEAFGDLVETAVQEVFCGAD